MIRLLILLAYLAIAPTITSAWQGSALQVVWQSPGWHCVYLSGGNRPDALIGCAVDHASYDLPTGNVDAAYAPQFRRSIVLRDIAQNETARVGVPARFSVLLPVVAQTGIPQCQC